MKTSITTAAITILALFLTSCAITFDPATGVPVITLDPDTVVLIASKGAEIVNENLIQATK